MTSATRFTVNDFWFVAWLVGGFLILVLNGVVWEIWYWHYWRTATFMPVPQPSGWHTKRFLLSSLEYFPLMGIAYAAAGTWCFRRRGVGVTIYAVFIGLVSFVQASSLGLM